MKVLFITRSHIGLTRGGLRRQILTTAQGLQKRGVEVIFYDVWNDRINDVDLCHCWSSSPDMIYHVEKARKQGKPVIISPVFGRFGESPWKLKIEYRLGNYLRGLFTPQKVIYKMFNACDRVISLNEEEARRLRQVFKIPEKNISIVPNGIHHQLSSGDPTLFQEKYGEGDLVLQVASINPNKNQLNLIKAVNGLPYRLFIIGPVTTGAEKYMKQCQREAGDNVVFVGELAYDDPFLASFYAAAKVFVLPSFSEVMPLAVYEAAQAGCNLVLSNTFPVSKLIKPWVYFVTPDNPGELKLKIQQAMESELNPELKKTALSMPTWQDVSDRIIRIYEEVLSQRQK